MGLRKTQANLPIHAGTVYHLHLNISSGGGFMVWPP